MESLLIGGAQDTGKSETIYRTANSLLSKGFTVIAGSVPTVFKDFRAVLKGFNKNDKEITVIINSATDKPILIQEFKDFFDLHGNYDILISSIRDDDFWPRKEFFQIMKINENDKSTLEIPLGKITRLIKYRAKPLKWYADKIDLLIVHTLNNSPFNI